MHAPTSDLIEEVQNTKITGDEEAFSHIDLVDFSGNVEGAQQAYASLRPGLENIDGTAVGAVGGGFAGYAVATAHQSDDDDTVDLRRSYCFYDQPHHGGIATPPQRYAVFMSFSLAAGAGRADLQALLAHWSAAAAVLQQGKPVGTVQPQVHVQPPTDTGEAYGLSPACLTVTVGLGPSVFGDRFGLAARRPAAFTDLPPPNGDNLDARLHGGDLSVQACADDPQVCYHAVRNLARLGSPASTPHETCWGSRMVPVTRAPTRSTRDSYGSTAAISPG